MWSNEAQTYKSGGGSGREHGTGIFRNINTQITVQVCLYAVYSNCDGTEELTEVGKFHLSTSHFTLHTEDQ